MAVTRDTGVASAHPPPSARASAFARRASAALADIVALGAPSACAGCGRPGTAVCAECGRPLESAPRLHRPSPTPPGWVPAHVVAGYDGTTRSVMTAWKERGRRDVAMHLARALARAIAAAAAEMEADDPTCPGVAIVPIPASSAARRRRGEDAWERVVRWAIEQCDTDASLRLVRALRLTRQPRDQAGLTASERRANLTGALACVESPGGRVVIVDDIITTGATLAEAARALIEAGVGPVRAAAIAATSRTSASPAAPHW